MSEFNYKLLVYEASQLKIFSPTIPLHNTLKNLSILCKAVHSGTPDLAKIWSKTE